MASITKLMTALVALEHASLDDVATVSKSTAAVGESTINLAPGERVTAARPDPRRADPERERRRHRARRLRRPRRRSARFVELMNAQRAPARARRHALREPGRPRRARPLLERARRDEARARGDAQALHPRDRPPRRRDRSRPRGCTTGTTCSRTSPDVIGVKTGHTDGAGWSQVAAARGARRHDLRDDPRRRDAARGATPTSPGCSSGASPATGPSGRSTASGSTARARTAYGKEPVRLVAAKPALRVVRVDRPLRGARRHARRGRAARREGAAARRGAGPQPRHGDRPLAAVAANAVDEAGCPRTRRVLCGPNARPPRGTARMIVTVTLNAALDRTLTVPNFQRGQRHRASQVLTLAGGKGINVARALKRLDVPVVATGPRGRPHRHPHRRGADGGGDPQRLRPHRRGVAHVDRGRRPDRGLVHGDQRVGAAGDAPTSSRPCSRSSTTSRAGPTSSSSRARCRAASRRASTPRPIRDLNRRGVQVVLDTEGQPLRFGIEAEPWLVSPNQREAEHVVGQELEEEEDFLMALDTIAELGARNVHITLETGCYALFREDRQVRRYHAKAPANVEAVSVVGAGDVLLAQFIAARLAGQDGRGGAASSRSPPAPPPRSRWAPASSTRATPAGWSPGRSSSCRSAQLRTPVRAQRASSSGAAAAQERPMALVRWALGGAGAFVRGEVRP